jgi:hypothetical protein
MVAIGAMALAVNASAQSIELTKDGQSDYVIVLARLRQPANLRAAREMTSYIKQISGAQLQIRDDSEPLPAHAILIGPSKYLDDLGVKLDPAKLGNDGFLLKTIGQRLVIAGPGPRGSMYGTYEVLEKLGVRWFTPTVTRLPHQPSIELPALDETQVPAFEYREPAFFEATDKNWAARNRMIGNGPHLDASTGGTIRYAQFVHTLDALVPRNLYKSHPEYFPLIKGKRVDGYVQRCLSNPDVLKLAIEGVKKAFAENPDAAITSVSQNDTGNWCTCDKCEALAKKYGGQSGVYLYFVNEVADAIAADPRLKGKLIGTLAYQFTEAPPTNISPRPNVRVRLCPISVCQAHPYETDDFPATKAFMKNLAGWKKAIASGGAPALYIWHYNTDFANYLQPFPDFAEFPADLKLYHRSGVAGVFFEGDYSAGGGGSDAELRSWLMAKLLWNPDQDSDALVTEWMKGVYGPAEKPMRAWFDLLQEKVKDPHQHFNCYPAPDIYYLSQDVLTQGDQLFDQAEKLAGDDAVASRYVAKARLDLRYVKLMRHPTTGPEFTSFVADCKKFGIQNISEGQLLDPWAAGYQAAHAPAAH